MVNRELTEPSIKGVVTDQMKAALKAGNKETLQFARNALAAIRKKEIDDRVELDKVQTQMLLRTLVKQRNESLLAFRQGGREDLVRQEEAEIAFLSQFLPPALSEAALDQIICEKIAEVHASSIQDLGKVMKPVLAVVAGQADGKLVSQKVREALAKLKPEGL